MGNWVIHAEGHGIHDNGRDDDIEVLFREFVKKAAETGGHVFSSATLTIGSTRELHVNVLYSGEKRDVKHVTSEWKYK